MRPTSQLKPFAKPEKLAAPAAFVRSRLSLNSQTRLQNFARNRRRGGRAEIATRDDFSQFGKLYASVSCFLYMQMQNVSVLLSRPFSPPIRRPFDVARDQQPVKDEKRLLVLFNLDRRR